MLHAINMIETEPMNSANATSSSLPTASSNAHQPTSIDATATTGPVHESEGRGADGTCGLRILQSEGLPATSLAAARSVAAVLSCIRAMVTGAGEPPGDRCRCAVR